GEDRAIEAAKQAIESPLLEVSIDGARGILFNVIGGNDLSMHEINAAAETITAAADPDANIIFGATINPELDGEVIITVVATGFDASYYAARGEGKSSSKAHREPVLTGATVTSTRGEEKDLAAIDMDLDDDQPTASDFHDDDSKIPNIWSISDDDDKDDSKKADDKDEQKDSKDKSDDDDDEVKVSLEDDLEKPSFLRRLSRRRKGDDDASDINGSSDDE
ncbi:MAG TPA: hypothetical protein VG604_04560, partial [Candidatus Saccharimonadales bacterium]|nr:hypothetical protein [Candidatus Saccharimonadales bacterium]